MIQFPAVIASTTLHLRNTGNDTVGRWLVSVKKTGGSFTIKPQKALSVGTTGATQHTMADCWYWLALANSEIAAGTTQTTDQILDIDASGCDVDLVITVAGGASLDVQAIPLAG
jgi:hypothetical protein